MVALASSFVIFFAVCFATSESANYSSRFDSLDVDEILHNERLLKNYFECLMERGPCTRDGAELKRTIPDALRTDCSKCSENQKHKAAKAIKFLQENKPHMFKELHAKYNPVDAFKIHLQEE